MIPLAAYVAANLLWLAGLTVWAACLARKKHRRERQFNEKVAQTIRLIAQAQKAVCEDVARDEDERKEGK